MIWRIFSQNEHVSLDTKGQCLSYSSFWKIASLGRDPRITFLLLQHSMSRCSLNHKKDTCLQFMRRGSTDNEQGKAENKHGPYLILTCNSINFLFFIAHKVQVMASNWKLINFTWLVKNCWSTWERQSSYSSALHCTATAVAVADSVTCSQSKWVYVVNDVLYLFCFIFHSIKASF